MSLSGTPTSTSGNSSRSRKGGKLLENIYTGTSVLGLARKLLSPSVTRLATSDLSSELSTPLSSPTIAIAHATASTPNPLPDSRSESGSPILRERDSSFVQEREPSPFRMNDIQGNPQLDPNAVQQAAQIAAQNVVQQLTTQNGALTPEQIQLTAYQAAQQAATLVHAHQFHSQRALTLLAEVPVYNGKHCGSFRDWITEFEGLANSSPWSDADKIDNLKTRLKGPAFHIFLHLYNNDDTYDQLKDKLIKHFHGSENEVFLRRELEERTRRPGESIRDFAFSLRRLHIQAYPLTESEASRFPYLEEAFLKGLSDPLQSALMNERHASFDDLVERADLLDAQQRRKASWALASHNNVIRNISQTADPTSWALAPPNGIYRNLPQVADPAGWAQASQNNVIRPTPQAADPVASSPAFINAMEEMRQSIAALAVSKQQPNSSNVARPKYERGSRHSPITCNFCGKRGHTMDRCFLRNSSKTCNYCGKNGHVRDECFLRNPELRFTHNQTPIICGECNQPGHLGKDCRSGNRGPQQGQGNA